jgi:hypothetical protein
MTIKNLYPSVRPTLDLNFAQTKQLDPRITFSRSSSGTYFDNTGVLRTASANQARFDHDPVTGESLGLLIEAAGTNLVLDSVNMNGTGWGRGNGTITLSAITSPDGVNPSYSWTNTQATGSFNYALITVASSTEYTFSFWYKAGSGRTAPRISLYDATNAVFFDDGPSYSTTTFPNGWHRLSYTFTSPATSTAVRVYVDRNAQETGTFYIWGVQVETGPFHTSYIPTAGSTVTRAADVAQITGANFSSWYNQSEGTLLTSIAASTVSNSCAWTISDGSANNRITSFTDNSSYSFYVVTGGSIQAQQAAGGYTKGARISAIGAYATNNFNYARSGTALTADTLGTVPVVNQLRIMAGATGGNIETGTISRLAYYPVRLPDATLQALTL